MKKKSFDREAELMDAAMDEFISKSYEEASLNRIIKNAGIGKGTFYYHFKDKQALYLSLIQSIAEVKIEFMSRKIADFHPESKDMDFFENFRLQSRLGLEFIKDYPRYYLLGMMYRREKGNKIYETAKIMLGDTTEKYFEELLDNAIKNGDLRTGISREFCLRILSFLCTRYDEIFDVTEDAQDFDTMLRDLDDLIDFIQYGMGKRE